MKPAAIARWQLINAEPMKQRWASGAKARNSGSFFGGVKTPPFRRAIYAITWSLAMCAALAAGAARAQAQTAGTGPAPHPAAATSAPSPSAAHPAIVLTPRYSPGDVLRYQVSLRSQSKSLVGGAVENPQGAAELGINVGLTLLLEVLPPIPTSAAQPQEAAPAPASGSSSSADANRAPLRLRATYERVSATLTGDSYDPAAAKLLSQYKGLEGRAIEFQLGPHGEVEYMRGMEEILKDERALEEARAWLQQLGAGLEAPATGVVPGQTWERTQAVPGAPLNGTELQSSSTYLRDEPCDIEHPAVDACAVVLMRFALGQKPGEKNATPEAFRKNGLRTSGAWTSHGESLIYVSLRTGRTVRVTQSSEEVMDLSIRHADGGIPFRYAGHSKTETHLLLLDETSASR